MNRIKPAGRDGGPCREYNESRFQRYCKHPDCKAKRAIAFAKCSHCAQRIGFDVNFVQWGERQSQIAHEKCERRKFNADALHKERFYFVHNCDNGSSPGAGFLRARRFETLEEAQREAEAIWTRHKPRNAWLMVWEARYGVHYGAASLTDEGWNIFE